MKFFCFLGWHWWLSKGRTRLDGPGITAKRVCATCGLVQVKNDGRWWFYGYTSRRS